MFIAKCQKPERKRGQLSPNTCIAPRVGSHTLPSLTVGLLTLLIHRSLSQSFANLGGRAGLLPESAIFVDNTSKRDALSYS